MDADIIVEVKHNIKEDSVMKEANRLEETVFKGIYKFSRAFNKDDNTLIGPYEIAITNSAKNYIQIGLNEVSIYSNISVEFSVQVSQRGLLGYRVKVYEDCGIYWSQIKILKSSLTNSSDTLTLVLALTHYEMEDF